MSTQINQELTSVEEINKEVQKYISSMLILGDTEDAVRMSAEKFRSMLLKTLMEEKQYGSTH